MHFIVALKFSISRALCILFLPFRKTLDFDQGTCRSIFIYFSLLFLSICQRIIIKYSFSAHPLHL